MSDERRRHRRIAYNLPLTLIAGSAKLTGLVYLTDLSAGGLLLMMHGACEVGRTLQLRFRWGAAACVATGRVIRVMPMGHANGVGVEFQGLDLAFAQFLGYLESLSPPQQPIAFSDLGEAEIVIW